MSEESWFESQQWQKIDLFYKPTREGRDHSVVIATRYVLEGSGMEFRLGARFSALVQTGPGAHPASYTVVTGSFPGVKWPGHVFDHPPYIVRRSKKSKTVHLLPFWAFFACSVVNFTKHPIQAMGTSSLLLSGKRDSFPRGETAET